MYFVLHAERVLESSSMLQPQVNAASATLQIGGFQPPPGAAFGPLVPRRAVLPRRPSTRDSSVRACGSGVLRDIVAAHAPRSGRGVARAASRCLWSAAWRSISQEILTRATACSLPLASPSLRAVDHAPSRLKPRDLDCISLALVYTAMTLFL